MGPEQRENLDNPRDANSAVSDELAWRAFCYFQGELGAEEAEAFEARLASEQPAREALAQAVELSHAMASALSSSDVRPVPRAAPASARSVRQKRAWVGGAWVGICTAICLAVIFVVSAIWRGRDFRKNDGDTGANLAKQDATAEAKLLAQAFPSGMDAWPVSEDEADAEGSAEMRDQSGEPGDGGLSIPALANDWIAMAFVAAQGATPQGSVKENR